MTKKALCVEINDYPFEGQDLNGCVNDTHAGADLLINYFDFPRSNVKILLDTEATQKNIVGGVKSLIADATAGDVLAFTTRLMVLTKLTRKRTKSMMR